mgnify:CR=1 FL=1
MKLTIIAKHLALAGVLTSLSLSAFAEVQPQDATPTTQQANNALYNKLPFADKTDFVKPSLCRQSHLINFGGLFKGTDGVYQIRNLDLSNMTIIEGEKGITVIDPLLSAEPAKEALDLYYANRGKKPVVAVVITHSHVDHYGGLRGVVDEADVKSGKVKIYAPDGFMKEAVSENIIA